MIELSILTLRTYYEVLTLFTNCCYLFALETELSVIEVPKGQLRFVSELRESNLQIRYNHS